MQSSSSDLDLIGYSISQESFHDPMEYSSVRLMHIKGDFIGVISIETLHNLMSEADFLLRFVLIDIREDGKFKEGHIERAVSINDVMQCKDFFFDQKKSIKSPIFYGTNCLKKSVEMAEVLRAYDRILNFGREKTTYKEVFILEGGYEEFIKFPIPAKELVPSDVPHILSPEMATPLRKILTFAHPTTYGRMQQSCKQMKKASKEIVVHRVLDFDLSFIWSLNRPYGSFIWNGFLINPRTLAYLAGPLFTVSVGTLSTPKQDNAPEREWSMEEIQTVIKMIKSLNVTKIDTIESHPHVNIGKLVVELIKNFSVEHMNGVFIFGAMLTPEISSLKLIGAHVCGRNPLPPQEIDDDEEHAHVHAHDDLEEDEMKEVVEFLKNTPVKIVRVCAAPLQKSVVEDIITSWASGERSFLSLRVISDFNLDDLMELSNQWKSEGKAAGYFPSASDEEDEDVDDSLNLVIRFADMVIIRFAFEEGGRVWIHRFM